VLAKETQALRIFAEVLLKGRCGDVRRDICPSSADEREVGTIVGGLDIVSSIKTEMVERFPGEKTDTFDVDKRLELRTASMLCSLTMC